TPSEERDQWYGLAGASQNAGIGIGSFIAGLLVAQTGGLGYSLLVIANALSFFLAASLLIFSPHTTPHSHLKSSQPMNYRAVFQDHPFLAFTAVNVIFALGSILLSVGLPLYCVIALHMPAWIIGSLLACNTVLLATMQTLLVQRLKPYRRTRVLALAGGLWAGWCLLYAFALIIPPILRLPYLFGATCLYTLAELLHAPTSNALAAEASPEMLRGRYLALFQMAFSLASILTPVLFTFLFTLSPSLPWLSGGMLLLCASIAMYVLERYLPVQAVRGVNFTEP
ncbi:MAG TPA: MFS transporter, partial [Ktedonobacter sp.]|nr:MFS transporter [Ktedonobacter sp.]